MRNQRVGGVRMEVSSYVCRYIHLLFWGVLWVLVRGSGLGWVWWVEGWVLGRGGVSKVCVGERGIRNSEVVRGGGAFWDVEG